MKIPVAIIVILLLLTIIFLSQSDTKSIPISVDRSRFDSESPLEFSRYVGHSHAIEVSAYDFNATPTTAQMEAAKTFREVSYKSAKEHGWFDYDRGISDGFEPIENDNAHYANETYMFDDKILDPNRPEQLMYFDTLDGKKLLGFMYYVRSSKENGPQIGGPLTLWHYHEWAEGICFPDEVLPIVNEREGFCVDGVPTYRSPQMLHVWFIDHPEGPFSTDMSVSSEFYGYDEDLLKI